jgi:hypothetical protein
MSENLNNYLYVDIISCMTDPERSIDDSDSNNQISNMMRQLAEYANSSARLSKLRNFVEEMLTSHGKEIISIPIYPYPTITLSSPSVFDNNNFLYKYLSDAIQKQIVSEPPSYIRISFTTPFKHANGDIRSGLTWATNIAYEDPILLLEEQLNKKNHIEEMHLAWGLNPFDIRCELCEAVITLTNLKSEANKIGLDTLHEWLGLGNENNSKAFTQTVTQQNISNWFQWVRIEPKSPSDIAAQLAVDLIKRTQKIRRPTALALTIDDFFEDTYDRVAGEIIDTRNNRKLEIDEIMSVSSQIMNNFRDYRSNEYD